MRWIWLLAWVTGAAFSDRDSRGTLGEVLGYEVRGSKNSELDGVYVKQERSMKGLKVTFKHFDEDLAIFHSSNEKMDQGLHQTLKDQGLVGWVIAALDGRWTVKSYATQPSLSIRNTSTGPPPTNWTGEPEMNVTPMTKEDVIETPEFVYCVGMKMALVRLERGGSMFCNRDPDCWNKHDESDCPWYVHVGFELPIVITLVMVLLGIVVHMAKEYLLGLRFDTIEAEKDTRTRLEKVTDKVIKDSINGTTPNEQAFEEIHRSPGGMALLIGAAFTLPLEPAVRHQLASFIRNQEQRLHGRRKHRWMSCVRKKAGSSKASEKFVDFLDEPGLLKRATYTTEETISKLFRSSKDQKTKLDKVKDLASSVIHAAIPQAKAAWYMVDYVKDTCFFAYLYHRLQFIIDPQFAWLQVLVYLQGSSILVAGTITGIVVQTNKTILCLHRVTSTKVALALRIVFFLCTPVVPVIVILQTVKLSREKETLKDQFRKNSETSPSKLYQKHEQIDQEKRKVMCAYADLRTIESSTEAMIQVCLLFTFTMVHEFWEDWTGLGLFEYKRQERTYAFTFLILSILQSFFTIILSTLSAMSARKNGQIDLKSKLLLGLSLVFQLAPHILRVVWTSLLALPWYNAGAGLGMTTASILLALPLLLHWISLVWLYTRLNITSFWSLPFKQKMLHLLANTWTVQPVRESKSKDQIQKSKEIAGSLLLTGLNLTITHTVTAFLIEDAVPIPDPTLYLVGVNREIFSKKRDLFLIFNVLPATLSFAIGCGLLLLFYKTLHPWRHLGKERERHCFGKLGGSKIPQVINFNSFICG